MDKARFGMIGLGTMGRNFLLNVAENGFSCAGYDLDPEKVRALRAEGEGFDVEGFDELEEFLDSLATPRAIMLLVPAGKIVDAVLGDLHPHLVPGDLVVDGGNSHFRDTERREAEMNDNGFEYLGVGVSGGAEGARHGPSIMVGGKWDAYESLRPVFEAASAKVAGEPCAARVGAGAAGHFVKMVHNGIEYGLMQLICETYDLMHRGKGMTNDKMASVFRAWDGTELNSYLVEITAAILNRGDDEGDGYLVDKILDTAGQKGTGRWTSEAGLEMGVPIPTIDSAVTMRQISSFKARRVELSGIVGNDNDGDRRLGADISAGVLKSALFSAFILTYAQGLSLLTEASKEKGYDLKLEQIAKIWRGGCIIRAGLLEDIRKAYSKSPELENLLFDAKLRDMSARGIADLRRVVAESARSGFASYCFASSIAYYDAYRSARLPANLLQAQRDFFGAHTYRRIDRESVFHTEWESDEEAASG